MNALPADSDAERLRAVLLSQPLPEFHLAPRAALAAADFDGRRSRSQMDASCRSMRLHLKQCVLWVCR